MTLPPTPPEAAGDAPTRDLDDCLDLSPLALMLCDEQGRILRGNAVWRDLAGGSPATLDGVPAVLHALMGWPGECPPAGQTRESSGWVDGADGRRHRLRVRVRGLQPQQGQRRWLVQFEDRSLEDERDLAQIEIAALMGDAEVGLATWDSAQGWVPRPPPRPRRPGPRLPGSRAAARGESAALTAVSKDLVEPDSLPEYERLQRALRQRERVEVRYAVRHAQTGRRWLMTRVEPADLGHGRSAFSVVTVDVSREEAARRRNEELLRELTTILDVSPAGIAYFSGGALVRCNRRFETLLGLNDTAPPGATLEMLLSQAGVSDSVVRHTHDQLARQDGVEVEFRLVPESGGGQPAWYALALRRTASLEAGGEETVAVLTDISATRTQQAALEGLTRERELMFSLSDVGILYQRDGRIERANQAIAELSGFEPAQLQGMPVSELFGDEADFMAHSATEKRELAESGRTSAERQLRRRDGRPLWVVSSQRLVNLRNPREGSICSFVSVDERRRVRELVVQQADRTRAILDSVLVGIVTVVDGGIEWMNRSARRMFGGELADFVGLAIGEVASEEVDHPLRRTDWLTRLEEGHAESFECRLKARDGREFWVVGNVVVTGGADGARQLTYALLDIDARRRAEVQIAQARASLQRILETAPLAIALLDARDQRVVQLNQQLVEFAARPVQQILHHAPTDWLSPAEAQVLQADLARAGAAHEMVQRELQRPDGQAWDVRIVSLRASADAPEQLLFVASDVSEQRAADQARLEAAISQREMLVKEVHHRIKNNLQGVAGLLQQNAQAHPEAATAIAEAVGQVHAIAQVHGLQVGMTGPLRIRGVVEAICSSVQRMFGRTVSVSVGGLAAHRFALTEADSIPVALTVNELLTNAIKHSQGGDIVCQLDFGDDEVAIAIRNTGRLAAGFSLAQVPAGISGLGLVRALLPRKGAVISLSQDGAQVLALLRLRPPAVALLAPL